jgi:hypothetical protein
LTAPSNAPSDEPSVPMSSERRRGLLLTGAVPAIWFLISTGYGIYCVLYYLSSAPAEDDTSFSLRGIELIVASWCFILAAICFGVLAAVRRHFRPATAQPAAGLLAFDVLGILGSVWAVYSVFSAAEGDGNPVDVLAVTICIAHGAVFALAAWSLRQAHQTEARAPEQRFRASGSRTVGTRSGDDGLARQQVIGAIFVVVVLALALAAFIPKHATRSERILEAWAEIAGLTMEEARIDRAEAFFTADDVCSHDTSTPWAEVTPADDGSAMASTHVTLGEAIIMAKAACPSIVEFLEAQRAVEAHRERIDVNDLRIGDCVEEFSEDAHGQSIVVLPCDHPAPDHEVLQVVGFVAPSMPAGDGSGSVYRSSHLDCNAADLDARTSTLVSGWYLAGRTDTQIVCVERPPAP